MNTELLSSALLITALGMGLVFAAILLLWALMELLVRLLADRQAAPAQTPAPIAPAIAADLSVIPSVERERKARAAAVAVAVLLAAEESHPTALPIAGSSAWQDASRTQALSRMAGYYRRPRPAPTRQGHPDEDYR